MLLLLHLHFLFSEHTDHTTSPLMHSVSGRVWLPSLSSSTASGTPISFPYRPSSRPSISLSLFNYLLTMRRECSGIDAAHALRSSRRLRAFKRWMIHQGIECSDALHLIDNNNGNLTTTITEEEEKEKQGLYVRAVCDLKVGDIVASIPKKACLTVKTSGAKDIIESQGLDGYLGLSFALMFEKSLAQDSPWSGYLQLLPDMEDGLPFVWTLDEVDFLLRGTELHKTIKEDKALMFEDWKECILPLMMSVPLKLNTKFFGVEQYFAAKSLIASRSFEIDNFHGFGMVPLADLFNHKTGAEDVHFTSISSHCESENVDNDNDEYGNLIDDEPSIQNSHLRSGPLTALGKISHSVSDLECSSTLADDPMVLEMIMVKNVKAGSEVFNTYGLMGNAALLHRYGFTEPNNPYDIVNIDLEIVLQWSLSLFSGRHSRTRLSLWRRLEYSACVSQSSEYFEISYDGEPQVDLLILLYIMLLPAEAYDKLDFKLSTEANFDKSKKINLSKKISFALEETSEMRIDLLRTKNVCDALLSLADLRESFYGNTLEDDIEALKNCCCIKDKKLYHSLMLRLSERSIIEKLRTYAASGALSTRTARRVSSRNKLKG